MKYYADLHLHSHFSRATSKQLNLEHLHKWAQLKGLRLVGTGDFVHPGWLDELQEKLEPAEEGLFKLKDEFVRTTQPEVPKACEAPVRFILSAEISNIYKKMDKVRKIHNVIFAPSFEAAAKIQARLDSIGNIRSDGRPILGMDSRDLLEITLEADPLAFLIPAHIWTPWFSALGSKGGFDRMQDCFGDLTRHIFAVETGLSSDPSMNWRLQQLDPYVLVSNSDAHSPGKLAREANIFDTELSYPAFYKALADPADRGLLGTIEFFPEEGKYHYDGHRKCDIRLHPKETAKHNGLCPVCGKPVTVGVMARVEELADRPEGEKPPRWRPFYSLVPLPEIIGEAKGVGPNTKTTQTVYRHLLEKLGNELFILREAPLEDIKLLAGTLVAEGMRRVRTGEIYIAAGYDGEFGVVRIFSPEERKDFSRQATFFPGEPAASPQPPDVAEPAAAQPVPEEQAVPGGGEDAGDSPPPESDSPDRVADVRASYAPPDAEMQLGNQLPEDVNAAQWKAVTHTGGHLLIVAGPGTGKTHTLTYRIAHIVQCLAPAEDILAITFTNKAAEEMQERLRLRLGDDSKTITIGTFHSFCLQLLRRYTSLAQLPQDFSIATPDDLHAVARELWSEHSAAERRATLGRISKWKARGEPENTPAEVEAFTAALRRRHGLDFDDLLLETLRLLRENASVREQVHAGYRYIFVDEYQDINGVQHALLKELVQDGVLLTAIGDPNQAIYGFRGADLRFFSEFETEFPGGRVLYLSENYRSARNLLAAASQMIRPDGAEDIPAPIAKLLSQGRLVIHNAPTEKAEAEYVVHQVEKLVGGTSMFSQDSGRVGSDEEAQRSFGDIAVLYRLNSQCTVLEEAFARSGIPYQVSGDAPLIEAPAVLPILSALRLAAGRAVQVEHGIGLLQFYARGFGDKAADAVSSAWRQAGGQIHATALQRLGEDNAMLPARVRDRIRQLAGELQEIGTTLAQAGLIEALQHFVALPGWQDLFSAHARYTENWKSLVRLARLHNGLDEFLDYLLLQREEDNLEKQVEKVSLLTLHAAKGLEFPVVYIVGCEDGLIPLRRDGETTDIAEERRLFYVGMTRAREQLLLVLSKKRSLYGKTRATTPSPFLADIEERLKAYDRQARKSRSKKATAQAAQMDLFG